MADLKTQLEIGVDGSSVESGVNKIKQSISSLGGAAEAAGTKGAAGLGKMGAAGDQTAKKLDQATKNLIANAQRNLAAIEAGVEANGRMSGRFIESLARQRGADINVLKPYIRDLDEAIAKQRVALGQNSQLLQRGPLAGATTSLGATSFNKPLPSNLTTSLGATAFGEVANAAAKAGPAVDAFNKKFDYTALTAEANHCCAAASSRATDGHLRQLARRTSTFDGAAATGWSAQGRVRRNRPGRKSARRVCCRAHQPVHAGGCRGCCIGGGLQPGQQGSRRLRQGTYPDRQRGRVQRQSTERDGGCRLECDGHAVASG